MIPKAGDIFSRALLEYTSDAITNTLSNVGYAFAKVNPIPTPNREDRTVAVNLQVVPGPRVTVRRILYKGNSRTSDEVLRREMRQFENTWYSQAAIDRSKIRLQRLGYFESVDVETPAVPGSNDQVDVVYNVKETTSGSFVFGLGYSQSFGVTTSVQLSQNNFLGGGNRVAVEASRSSYQQRYAFSYTNPFFTDDGVSLGYNLSWRALDYSDFNTAQFNSKNGSAQVVFGVPITENDTVSAMVGIDSNQITTFAGTTPQAIIDYINAIGTRTFHAWRTELGWARDTRNDFFMPTRGMYQRVGLETTLPGSTVEYYKLNYQISNYWPIIPALVLNTRFELGYGDSYGKDSTRVLTNPDGSTRTVTATGLPFYENFYAGGTTRSVASKTTPWARVRKRSMAIPAASRWADRSRRWARWKCISPSCSTARRRAFRHSSTSATCTTAWTTSRPTSCAPPPVWRCCGARRSAPFRSAMHSR